MMMCIHNNNRYANHKPAIHRRTTTTNYEGEGTNRATLTPNTRLDPRAPEFNPQDTQIWKSQREPIQTHIPSFFGPLPPIGQLPTTNRPPRPNQHLRRTTSEPTSFYQPTRLQCLHTRSFFHGTLPPLLPCAFSVTPCLLCCSSHYATSMRLPSDTFHHNIWGRP